MMGQELDIMLEVSFWTKGIVKRDVNGLIEYNI